MKKLIALLMALSLLALSGCSSQYVDPGNVGVKVNLYGSDKGVSDTDIVDPGRVWYNPFYTAIYEFPTYNQQAKWAKSNTIDESISFNSIEGSSVNVDVGLSYHFEREKIPHIFKKFRKDAHEITHGFLRQRVQDAFNEHGSTMKITDIFGAKKHELLLSVQTDLIAELKEEGFEIDTVSFLGSFRVDPQVEQSINMTIAASQRGIEAQNKLVQIKAEADQAIEKARGTSEATLVSAKAQAEANKILAESLTPELVQYEALKMWNGVLPHVVGGSTIPFVNVTPPKDEKAKDAR